MPTIQDLFKSKKNDLYGLQSNILIESRGIIDIKHSAALLTSSPDAAADLIGNQIGGALGGNANRPTDTIFRKKIILAKPISLLAPTHALLRNAVKEGTNYYIKDHPAPASVLGKILGGASPASVAKDLAFKALQNTDDLKNLVKGIIGRGKEGEGFGMQYHRIQPGPKGFIKTEDKEAMFSTHYIKYVPTTNEITKAKQFKRSVIAKRENTPTVAGVSQWDIINMEILKSGLRTRGEIKEKFLDVNKGKGLDVPYMLIEHYGKKDEKFKGDILLPGTITGITETATPNVSSFKYVGSPFNLYRYGGVERALTWNVKLYYVDTETKFNMLNNLDKLRRLVFPDEEISAITYGGADANENSPLLYNPNLVYVTIGDVYTKMFGIIDSLTITIDDGTPWVTTDYEAGDGRDDNGLNKPYPVTIDVAMSMKCIETPKIAKKDKDVKYDYTNYFTATGAEVYLKDNIEKKETEEEKMKKSIDGLIAKETATRRANTLA